ncbi:MAG: biopolymer transporter ExbD [Phycisphaeraceae bacterium]|nr:biopolymer transporter ExbD [Phycisphaeraceae bacterium]
MKFGRPRLPTEASFDLTPMIDVVLLLIIFFTLTSHFAKTQLLPLDLPKEKGAKVEAAQPTAIYIDLRADGRLAVLGVESDGPTIARMVQSEVLRGGDAVEVVIRAERLCPTQHLNRLAELLATAGVRSWKLATIGEGS